MKQDSDSRAKLKFALDDDKENMSDSQATTDSKSHKEKVKDLKVKVMTLTLQREKLLEQLETQGKTLNVVMPEHASMKAALEQFRNGGVDGIQHAKLLEDLQEKDNEIVRLNNGIKDLRVHCKSQDKLVAELKKTQNHSAIVPQSTMADEESRNEKVDINKNRVLPWESLSFEYWSKSELVQGMIELDQQCRNLQKQSDTNFNMMKDAQNQLKACGKAIPDEMNEHLKKTARSYFFGIVWPKEKLLSASKESLLKSCLVEVYKALKLNHGICHHETWKEMPEHEFLRIYTNDLVKYYYDKRSAAQTSCRAAILGECCHRVQFCVSPVQLTLCLAHLSTQTGTNSIAMFHPLLR